jgi:hypothetical protein
MIFLGREIHVFFVAVAFLVAQRMYRTTRIKREIFLCRSNMIHFLGRSCLRVVRAHKKQIDKNKSISYSLRTTI